MVAVCLLITKIKTMAKHAKKRKKTTTRRRRRVGAMALSASNPLVKFGPIALGFFMGDKINEKLLSAVGDKVDKKIIAAGEAGLGYMLVFGKGKKSLVKSIAGGIALGAGAKLLMQSFGIGGIGPYGNVPVIAGPYGRVPVISGRKRVGGPYTPNSALNGYNPHGSLSKVMGSVEPGSGSGITNTSGGEMMN